LVIVAVLALGIGANTAIFTVVNAVLLRPLPYPDSDQLVMLWQNKPSKGMREQSLSALDYLDFDRQQQVFDKIGAFRTRPANLTGTELPERVDTIEASSTLFGLLGAAPSLGRAFAVSESQAGKNHVALLSDGFWRRHFAGDPNILGKAIVLDSASYTIVGVMPAGFRLLDAGADVWLPYAPTSLELMAENRAYRSLKVIAHLKKGASFTQASDQMRTIARRLEQEYQATNAGFGADLVPLREQMTSAIRPTLVALLCAVAFVLLVACANVANLLLARAGVREKEMAVRTALGAQAGRLLQQLLTESVLISLTGGIAGTLLAYWGVSIFVALAPAGIPRVTEISPDWRVLAFSLGLSVATGIAFGLAPALSVIHTDLNSVLKVTGRSTSGNRARTKLRNALVVCEVAACVVLLGCAGLLLRTVQRLQQVNPGFQPDHVLTMQIALPDAKYAGLKVAVFHQRLLDRVRAIAGVQSAGVARYLPLSNSDASLNFQIQFQPVAIQADQPRAKYRAASSGYFQAMRISLIQGRYFDESDGARTPRVAIVNEAAARQFWRNDDPIGKRISPGIDPDNWYTIVGIVGDVKHAGLDTQINPEVYYHYLQVPAEVMNYVEGTMTLVARTSADPSAMAGPIRSELLALDLNQPVFNVRTMDDLVRGSVAQQRFRAALLTVFSGLALVLAALGLYGVIAHSVNQRTNELGVRRALGAQTNDLLRLVVGHGMRLALIGLGIGLVLAICAAKLISKLLFGVNQFDPMSLGLTAAVILSVALAASYIPALRAIRIDPVKALREE
jgi:putative ABC transport system permease protein